MMGLAFVHHEEVHSIFYPVFMMIYIGQFSLTVRLVMELVFVDEGFVDLVSLTARAMEVRLNTGMPTFIHISVLPRRADRRYVIIPI